MRAFEHDLAAVLARAGAQIHDVVRGAHHVGVVLDHHDRVAEPAQFFEDVDQAAGVAAVESDRRLVEHIAGADQPRAQRRRELDALRLAAGERGRKAVEREVFESDVVQKFQALADLDKDFVGDAGLFRGQLQARKKFCASAMFICTISPRFLPPTRT